MHLLVAVDGSSESHDALRRAIRVAEATGGSITVVHAVDPDVYELGGMEPISGLPDAENRILVESVEDAEDRGADVLAEAVDLATANGVAVDSELLYGPPVDRIVAYAGDHDVDGIYVGHRGMSARLEGLLGSVAKSLAERATVPVTIVR